jgi:hypothetical protein
MLRGQDANFLYCCRQQEPDVCLLHRRLHDTAASISQLHTNPFGIDSNKTPFLGIIHFDAGMLVFG